MGPAERGHGLVEESFAFEFKAAPNRAGPQLGRFPTRAAVQISQAVVAAGLAGRVPVSGGRKVGGDTAEYRGLAAGSVEIDGESSGWGPAQGVPSRSGVTLWFV